MESRKPMQGDNPGARRPLRLPHRRRLGLAIALLTSLGLAALLLGFLWLQELGITSISQEHIFAITRYSQPDNSIVFDRNGEKIGEFFSHYYIFTPYEKLPPFLISAIVAVEDRSFYRHHGIDAKGIIRAVLVHFGGRPYAQGASTITQQIVRNFLLSPEKTIERKIREIALAFRLEAKLSKAKIFEIYANALFLGNGAYGVGAAARRYFGKDLNDLADHELAVIAGLFQSPSRYNPDRFPKRAKARQRQVLGAMVRAGMISAAGGKRLESAPLVYHSYENLNEQTAPYYIDYVREQVEGILDKSIKNQGLRIYTTLDMNLQRMAQKTIDESKGIFDTAEYALNSQPLGINRGSVEAAILVTEPKTGDIVAMVGGRDYKTSQFNRTVSSLRSPGSAFKPVVFSEALRQGWKWSDLLYVSPVSIEDYRPRNSDGGYLDETTLLRAFYKSINTSAVEVGSKIGLDNVIRNAHRLGIKSQVRQEIGSVLGASEVTMLDMATMYGTFANKGTRTELITITRVENREGKLLYKSPTVAARSEEVFTPDLAYILVQGMSAVFRHGTAFSKREWADTAAGKTGTSNDARDNWFCGFTPNLVSIVWLGTDEPSGFTGNAGASLFALPLWDNFMKQAITERPRESFVQPPGVVMAKVHSKFGYLSDSGVNMGFLLGQEPSATESGLEPISRGLSYRNLFD